MGKWLLSFSLLLLPIKHTASDAWMLELQWSTREQAADTYMTSLLVSTSLPIYLPNYPSTYLPTYLLPTFPPFYLPPSLPPSQAASPLPETSFSSSVGTAPHPPCDYAQNLHHAQVEARIAQREYVLECRKRMMLEKK